MPYKEVFQFLVNLGLLDVILPFLLVFLISYSTLQKTGMLGLGKKDKPRKELNAMIAFVMGFFAVLATNLLSVMNIIMFYFVLLLMIGLMLALVIGIAGGHTSSKFYIAIMLFLAGVFVFYGLAQFGIVSKDNFFKGFLLPLALLGLIVWGLYSFFKKEKSAEPEKPSPKRERPPEPEPEEPRPEPHPSPYGQV